MTAPADEPLTVADLARAFASLGVTGHNLPGGGRPDDIHLIEERSDGWVVAYRERGQESSVRIWPTEAEACRDLFARVTGYEHNFFACVVPPAPAADADAAWTRWLARRGATEDDLAPGEWKTDDVPWRAGSHARRYFVRHTAVRRLEGSSGPS